jgi:RsiW-degrading membrane proteinase PrsW (M82 family)
MQPMLEYYPRIYYSRWKASLASSHEASDWPSLEHNPDEDGVDDDDDDDDDDEGDEHDANNNNNNNIRKEGHTGSTTTSDRHTVLASVPTFLNRCFPPLSLLSYRILQTTAILLAILLVWSFVGPYYWRNIVHARIAQYDTFNVIDFFLLVATFGQAIILVLILAHFINRNKHSELSFDAIVKYFASGFILSTSLAIFYECILGVIVRIMVSIGLALAGVNEVVNTDGYQHYANTAQTMPGFSLWSYAISTSKVAMTPYPSISMILADETPDASEFLKAFGYSHPIFYTLYLLLNAFVLAAFVEEMCKYFGFRMVEHPDFLSSRELEAATRVLYHDDDTHSTTKTKRKHLAASRVRYEKQRESLESHGAAITLAMITTAMGFTCCENLVYIFIYSDSSPVAEFAVLIARTLFPVHPLAAAIQSIGVIRRNIEHPRDPTGGHGKFQLGHIVFPAIVFHGGYDFFLLWIDYLETRHGTFAAGNMNSVNDDDDDKLHGEFELEGSDSFWGLVISVLVSVAAMMIALWYYLRENQLQRSRLKELDRHNLIAKTTGHARMV